MRSSTALSAEALCGCRARAGAAPGSLALLGAGEAPPGGPRSLAESPEHSCQAGGDVEAPRAYGALWMCQTPAGLLGPMQPWHLASRRGCHCCLDPRD